MYRGSSIVSRGPPRDPQEPSGELAAHPGIVLQFGGLHDPALISNRVQGGLRFAAAADEGRSVHDRAAGRRDRAVSNSRLYALLWL